MISESSTRKWIVSQPTEPEFSSAVSEIEHLENEIRKVKQECAQKLRNLRKQRKKVWVALSGLKTKRLRVKEQKRKVQFWQGEKLIQEMVLQRPPLQLSLFDYLHDIR